MISLREHSSSTQVDIARDIDIRPMMRAVVFAPPSAGEAEGKAAELQTRDMRADAPLAIGLGHGERGFRPDENVVPDPVPKRSSAPEMAPCGAGDHGRGE